MVHATHGIALFQKIVQQEVAGKKRDYFLLTYAQDDKLYVPFEQVDKITRYIGPDGSTPRLTRLNSADWSRACTRARKSAQKMAFDLVDLYTRRSTIKGFSFSFDTPAQEDMETSFPYTLTRDQARALDDIKADMQSVTPMDRLLCGDVGLEKPKLLCARRLSVVRIINRLWFYVQLPFWLNSILRPFMSALLHLR